MILRLRHLLLAAALLALTAAAAAGGGDLDQMSLYGVNHESGALWRYGFDEGQLTEIGTVRTHDGQPMLGVHAAGYIDGFQQIHVFWLDPSDNQSKMLLADADTARSSLDVINLGTGAVTGAVSYTYEEATNNPGTQTITRFKIFALQDAVGDGDGIAGGININPSNTGFFDFELHFTDGRVYTHNDLHDDAPIDAEGVLAVGEADYIRVRPKGNGNQNGLVVNGQDYTIQNGTVYEITSDSMTVRLQNSKVRKGRPIGHWWIDITATFAVLRPGDGEPINAEPNPVSKLIRIDTQTRDIDNIRTLSRGYDGLASLDGQSFYATADDTLYHIDGATGAETAVKTFLTDQLLGLEFCNGTLMVFENAGDFLLPIDALTGELVGDPIDTGMYDLGTIVFVRQRLFQAYD